MSFWSRMRAGLKAFREAYVTADVQPGQQTAWGDLDGRALRYALYWAFFENTAYRNVHRWAQSFRAQYGLYAHTRNIYNPAYRLAEFWVAHLMGGPLDPNAGALGAIPIELGSGAQTRQGQALRDAIATLWRQSNWPVQKDIWTRYGSVMGDVGLKVIDDPLRRLVRLEIVHPSTLTELDKDPQGFVKRYTIEEPRPDPRPAYARGRDARLDNTVTYCEVATRDGNDVVYQTYLNNTPYAWNDIAAEWREPYGFVPLIVTQHLNVGMAWGWSELHAGLPKIRELDDIASKFDDQIRKIVDSPWLLAGVQNPNESPRTARTGTSGQPLPPTTNRETGREEVPILYASDPQAKPHPMVAPLDLPGVMGQIEGLIKELERDYPELALDVIARNASDASGRALRVAREPVETKVTSRRATYDADLVRAHQMGVAIGGFRGYEGYQGFDLDSYAAGALDHSVAPRSVFAIDPIDELDQQQRFWTVAGLAAAQGMPLDLYLEEAGWDQAKIARVVAAQAKQQAEAAAQASAQSAPNAPPDPKPTK
jgi:hypothetical protein